MSMLSSLRRYLKQLGFHGRMCSVPRDVNVRSNRSLLLESLEDRVLMSVARPPTFIGLIADPSDATKTALSVVGTSQNDNITFKPGNTPGSIVVKVNKSLQGTYSPTGHIIADGGDGDDKISVSKAIRISAILHGGLGQDLLVGGSGPDVLMGDHGTDTLVGNTGRDILVGGSNLDRLRGLGDDDILIGGVTDTGLHDQAMCAILDEWNSSRDYNVRVSNIRDGSGSVDRLNGSFFLSHNTVNERASGDRLFGSTGRDWFFVKLSGTSLTDVARDSKPDEQVDRL